MLYSLCQIALFKGPYHKSCCYSVCIRYFQVPELLLSVLQTLYRVVLSTSLTFFIIHGIKVVRLLRSLPSYCFHHSWTILNKYSHTCERNIIEIYERENIQAIFIYTWKNAQERKRIYKGEILTFCSIRKALRTPHTIFQRFHSFCNAKLTYIAFLLFLVMYWNLKR